MVGRQPSPKAAESTITATADTDMGLATLTADASDCRLAHIRVSSLQPLRATPRRGGRLRGRPAWRGQTCELDATLFVCAYRRPG
jgi:hypothetical protein